jgi:hypothetical protein
VLYCYLFDCKVRNIYTIWNYLRTPKASMKHKCTVTNVMHNFIELKYLNHTCFVPTLRPSSRRAFANRQLVLVSCEGANLKFRNCSFTGGLWIASILSQLLQHSVRSIVVLFHIFILTLPIQNPTTVSHIKIQYTLFTA